MWHTLTIEEVKKSLKTNLEKGLTNEEVEKRKEKFGTNELVEKNKTSIIVKFLNQFKDFMIIILIFAAVISAGLAFVEGTNEYIDSVIIVVIVVLNAIMGVIQEEKAEKSLEALKKMSAPTCKIKRDGEIVQIESKDLVVGDIVYLETGSYVPADLRLIDSHNLKVEESALTGETIPVIKDEEKVLSSNAQVADMINMAFATTVVVGGHGIGIVVETGMNTKVGKIATMIIEETEEQTPLQRKLRRSW